jgi:CubicO group peptidase (beta-lactamase class C family)
MTAESRAQAGGRFGEAYRVLEEAIGARAFPGCAFGVLAGGRVVLADALGRFTYEEDARAVLPSTVFDVASLTKVAATTAAAMLLVERGKLSLDWPLGEVLPGFVAGRGADDPALRVTVRHLLAHNSGLPGIVEFFRTESSAASLLSACLGLKLEAEPGARAEYSDPGFILLGKAIEAVAGEGLDAWTRREVFGPLGMSSTVFCPAEAVRGLIPPTEMDSGFRGRVIQGEVQDENAFVLGGVAGHAGVFSCAGDLLRFSAAVMGVEAKDIPQGLKPRPLDGENVRAEARTLHESSQNGTAKAVPFQDSVAIGRNGESGSGIFSSETVRLFAERQGPEGSSRALGWDTPSQPSSSGRYFSPQSIGHLGFSGCSLWIDLEAGVAVVLLTNRTWPDRASQLIRQVRPAFHDAVREGLQGSG